VERLSLPNSVVLAFTLIVAIHAHAQNAWVRVHGGSWEPDSQVVTELRAGLERYVKATARGQGRELRNWAEYIFQYQGREEKGQKYILVNAICRRDPEWNLEKQLIFVFDGGPCFFNLRFDPKRRQYYDLAINGYA
jgi:hypothetical protein